jgi:hypothetical protein
MLCSQKKDARRAARHRLDPVQARRGIKHHVAGWQLHAMDAVAVLDHQLTPVVIFGIVQKQRRRQIGADAMRRARHRADRVVDVITEGLAALIAVEQGRKYLERQSRRQKQRIAFEGRHDQSTHLAGCRIAFRHLHIVLGPGRLMTGRDAAIDPNRTIQSLPALGHLLLRQHLRNLQQHGRLLNT